MYRGPQLAFRGGLSEVQRMETLRERLARITERLTSACQACGRQPTEVTIVAVTKTFPPEIVAAALGAGLKHIAENKVQEGLSKAEIVRGRGVFHLIGNLQSNKVKKAVEIFDWIQTIDDLPIAEEISRRAAAAGRQLEVLIEVNSSGEAQKHGCLPSETARLAELIAPLQGLHLRGLMTVGPLTEDRSKVEQAFDQTRALFDMMHVHHGPAIDTLSMGMSDDFELAVRHGSTMIRLGSVLFGER